MNSLNSVLLEGILIADPNKSVSLNDQEVCTFSIENVRMFKKEEEIFKETSHYEIQSFSTLAENCNVHLKEGRGVRVVGRLKQITTENKNQKVVIIAEHIEFKPVSTSEKTLSKAAS